MADYCYPVAWLITLGEPVSDEPAGWLDYPACYGFTTADIGELVRLACDRSGDALDDDRAETWAPEHAWRALGQLGDASCVAPLLAFLATADEFDALCESFPVVAGMIGPAAIPALAACLADRSIPAGVTMAVAEGLKSIGSGHPDSRAACVGLLAGLLEPPAASERYVNGVVVCSLMDLRAVEAIDTIRAAFAAERIDPSLAGDLEDVEIGLGLRTRRDTPQPHYNGLTKMLEADPEVDFIDDDFITMPFVHAAPKLGRNDPCSCGSGKKFKKCCLP